MRLSNILIAGAAVLSMAAAVQAVPIAVLTRVAQNANDSLLWQGLTGPDYTNIATPVTLNSVMGIGVTVQNASGVVNRAQNGVSWGGNFGNGDFLLYNTGGGPTSLFFGTPVFGVGFQVQTNFYGAYSGQVDAFDSLNNLLGTFAYSGTASGANDNTAAYVGFVDTLASIDHIVITGLTATSSPNDFSINQLSINAAAAPEVDPTSATAPLAFLCFGLLAFSRHRREALCPS